jgi:hypothetical protein
MSDLVPNTKRCRFCEEEIPLKEFWKDKTSPDGLQSYCKPCTKIYSAVNIDKLTPAQRALKSKWQEKVKGPDTKEKMIDYMRVNSSIPLKILEKAQMGDRKITMAQIRAATFWIDFAFKDDITHIEITGKMSLVEALKSALEEEQKDDVAYGFTHGKRRLTDITQ